MIIHEPTRSLLLRVRDPSPIIAHIPKYQLGNFGEGHNIAIRHGLDEVKILRNLGISAPSPILSQYDWPGKWHDKIMHHQRVTAEALTLYRRMFVLNETGTMKTASSLWAADYLMRIGKVRKVLVVSTLSSLEQTWLREIFNVLMHRSAVILHHTDREVRKFRLAQDVDFYIINHDGVAVIQKELRAKQDIDLVIVDEAGVYRNGMDKKGKYGVLQSIIRPDSMVWLLTATPCPNAPTDAYALAKLVSPSRVPKYFGEFKRDTMLQITQYKWIPKKNAYDTAYQAMQPAVRFRKADCLDLPPVVTEERTCELSKEQTEAYKRMKAQMVLEMAAGPTITAVNAADQINKLRQILCIASGTPILTHVGWKEIQTLSTDDLLWDGVEWVSHGGLVPNGIKQTVRLDGVRMTPDHSVLTVLGWRTAKEILDVESSNRLDRESVRLPDGDSAAWNHDRHIAKGDMAVSLRLRSSGSSREPEPTCKEATQREALRLPSQKHQRQTSHVIHTPLQNMDTHEASMLRSDIQGLEELRSARYSGLFGMVGIVRKFLARHGCRIRAALNTWSKKQRQRLFKTELSVGDRRTAGQQHSPYAHHTDSEWRNDAGTRGGILQLESTDAILSAAVGMVCERSVSDTCTRNEVFDIKNCGPRNRFIVRGVFGELLIVHNCGAIKHPDTGEYEVIPHEPRFKLLLECIELAAAKVIVVIPFKGIVYNLQEQLEKYYSCAVLNGDVSANKRNQIINAFKTTPDPHVLLCHPKVVAHSLNLTEADMLIFYAPIYSNDEAMQVIERFNRPGQTRKMTIIRMWAHPLETSIYKMLDAKQVGQANILDLYKQELEQ